MFFNILIFIAVIVIVFITIGKFGLKRKNIVCAGIMGIITIVIFSFIPFLNHINIDSLEPIERFELLELEEKTYVIIEGNKCTVKENRISSKRIEHDYVKEIRLNDVCLIYLENTQFKTPQIFECKAKESFWRSGITAMAEVNKRYVIIVTRDGINFNEGNIPDWE